MGTRSEDTILAAIEGLKHELTLNMDKKAQEIIEAVNQKVLVIEEDVKTLKEENNLLKMKIEKQDEKIRTLEKESKGKELIVHGLEERETSEVSVERLLLDFFRSTMQLAMDGNDLDKAFRLGKKMERPRPIRVIFAKSKVRDTVISKRKALKGSKIFISENFPKEVLETRKALLPEVKKLREEGKTAFIKYDKIIVQDKQTQKTKRLPSDSADQNSVNRSTKQQKTYTPRSRNSSVSSASGLKMQNIKDFLASAANQQPQTMDIS